MQSGKLLSEKRLDAEIVEVDLSSFGHMMKTSYRIISTRIEILGVILTDCGHAGAH